jgi:hypothetical protein
VCARVCDRLAGIDNSAGQLNSIVDAYTKAQD